AVGFSDDFAVDSSKEYRSGGVVAWRKGGVVLGREGRLERPLAVGFTAELRAGGGFAGARPRGAALPLTREGKSARAELRCEGEELRLHHDSTRPAQVVTLGPAGAGPWEVRLAVDHGLIRVKAWRQGTPEPAGWAALRALEQESWRPEAVVA